MTDPKTPQAAAEPMPADGQEGLPEPSAFAAGMEANMRGFLDVMAWSEGEFTTPLYTAAQVHDAIRADRASRAASPSGAAKRLELAMEALRKIAALDDEWGPFPDANNPLWGAMAIVTAREVYAALTAAPCVHPDRKRNTPYSGG